MTYRTEFPDFPSDAMPTMPEGFVDQSWHNDACPRHSRGDLHIWTDYPSAADREWEGQYPRFMITRESDEMGFHGIELTTDDWADVLAFLQLVPA